MVVRQGWAETVSQRSSKNEVVDLVGNFGKEDMLKAQTPRLPGRELPPILNTVFLHKSQKQIQKSPSKTWNSIHH